MAVLTHLRSKVFDYASIPFLIVACAGFTIGLTFVPCYSSMCVEHFYPYQARLHIALYYTLLASIAIFLAAQLRFKTLDRLSSTYLFNTRIPILGARLSTGGLLLSIWIGMLSFGSIGYWYPAQYAWWDTRGALVDPYVHMHQVAWTGITGHWIDIWIGLVMIPVSRNSILGRVFELHVSTMLFFHKILAYALFTGALVHGVLYYVFVASIASAPPSVQTEFPVDNPTMTASEAKAKIPLGYIVLPTGVISFILILVILITSLPAIRRRSYNAFYFIHVVFAVAILVLTCLHASTNFYFLLPGIFLWVGDWIWRIFHSLRKTQDVTLENAGGGWYRVRLPVQNPVSVATVEKGLPSENVSSYENPLETHHINIPSISKLQVHPFIAAVTASDGQGPVLLFRQAAERQKAKDSDKEWTRMLGAMIDASGSKSLNVKARIEGPYRPIVRDMHTANHVLLVVGGSGITGALSISNWWESRFGSATSQTKSLCLVWTVRTLEITEVEEFQQLQAVIRTKVNMDFTIHVSSQHGHLNCGEELNKTMSINDHRGSVWVYASGPDGLLLNMEDACHRVSGIQVGKGGPAQRKRLSWYIANWTA